MPEAPEAGQDADVDDDGIAVAAAAQRAGPDSARCSVQATGTAVPPGWSSVIPDGRVATKDEI
jgi:hypothetical protein